ncbi:hypothetical protein Goarm_022382, partial [Gossypium armourianum]|nr:hypothetical protein [Gossypium armourianum]
MAAGVTATGGAMYKQGDWIFGFNQYLGVCSIFYTELWGILD